MKVFWIRYYVMTILLLALLDIVAVKVIRQKNIQMTLKLAGVFHACSIILAVYLLVFSASCYNKVKLLENKTLFVYKFPDDKKVNLVNNTETEKYVKDSSLLEENNYYDKVSLKFKYKNISYLAYLKNIIIYPFCYAESQYFDVEVNELNNTVVETIQGTPVLEEYDSVVNIGSHVFRYTEQFRQGMLNNNVTIQVCYELPNSENEIIENYLILKGEY